MGARIQFARHLVNLVHLIIPPPHFAKLRTADDPLDGCGNVMIVGFEFGEHGCNQRLVGELDAASEGVAEKLATELLEKVLTAIVEKIRTKPVESLDFRAVEQLRPGVNG